MHYRPIGVKGAARIANVDLATIEDAMSSGSLMWKHFKEQRMTTRRWIQEWQQGQ